MKITAVMTAPDPGAEALISEARRHQRRRYAVTGAAVAAVLAASLAMFAGLHGFGGSRRAAPPRPGLAAQPPVGPRVPGRIPASVDTTVLMWPTEGDQALQVLDVVTGRLKSFAAPPGTTGWAPTHGGNWAWSASEISPSGQLMAAQAVLAPASQGLARVFIIHLTGPDARAVAVPSSAAFLLSVTAWSPDSSWLFYQGPGEHLWAYQVTTGQVRSSTTTCCQYAVMATLAS